MSPEQEKRLAMRILLACMKNQPTLGDIRRMVASAGHSDVDAYTIEAIHEYVAGHLERMAHYFEARLS